MNLTSFLLSGAGFFVYHKLKWNDKGEKNLLAELEPLYAFDGQKINEINVDFTEQKT